MKTVSTSQQRGAGSRLAQRRTRLIIDFGAAQSVRRCAFNSIQYGARAAVQPPCATSSIDASLQTSKDSGCPKFGIACSPGPRDEMEDECNCISEFGNPNTLYAGVFDGHGGSEVALWLNENLQDFVAPALQQSGNYEAALQAAFHAADAEVLEVCRRASMLDENFTGPGATATVVVVNPNEAITANLGDSSAVLQRKGRQVMLSREHRVYGKDKPAKLEIQRVEDTGGWVSRDGRVCDVLAVSRAFGDLEFKGQENLQRLLQSGVEERAWTQKFADKVNFTSDPVIATPAVTYTPVGEELGDEFIIMASDGLWDFWNIPSIMQCASNALSLGATESEVADILVEKALKRFTSDNVAVVVITFPWTKKVLDGKAEAEKSEKSRKRKSKYFGLF